MVTNKETSKRIISKQLLLLYAVFGLTILAGLVVLYVAVSHSFKIDRFYPGT
jgi:hypothetical protein